MIKLFLNEGILKLRHYTDISFIDLIFLFTYFITITILS
jgi:hypothetical protein